MHRATPIRILTAAVLVAFPLAACGEDGEDGTDTTTTAPTAPTTAPDATPTTAGGAGGEDDTDPNAERVVRAYFVLDGKVFPVRRTSPDAGVAQAAMEALVDGPTAEERAAGYFSALPEGTEVLGLSIEGDLATVDLSEAFTSGGGSASMQARVAQVVFTVTQFANVERVRFEVDGSPVEAIGGEGIMVDEPQTRADWEDLAPAILPEAPLPGETVTSPFTVEGSSNTFEATYQYRVERPDGSVIVEDFGTATSGTGTRGTFSTRVDTGDVTGPVTLVLFETSMEDGSEMNVVRIPLRVD